MSGLRDEVARARETLETAGVTLGATLAPVELPPVEDHALALVLRESVTNIVRHAQATRTDVCLATGPAGLTLVIADDGRGARGASGQGFRACARASNSWAVGSR